MSQSTEKNTKTTEVAPKLVAEIKQLSASYQATKPEREAKRVEAREAHSKRLAEQREVGSTELLEELKSLVEGKVKQYATVGRQEARLFEFTFEEGKKYAGCFAKDLLSKGNVVSRLQSWLDAEHSDNGNREFLAYFNLVGRPQQDRTKNKYAVFVNWDKSAWAAIEERLANRQISQTDEDKVHQPRLPRVHLVSHEATEVSEGAEITPRVPRSAGRGRGAPRGGPRGGFRGGSRGGPRGGPRGGGNTTRGAPRGTGRGTFTKPLPTEHTEE